jgi:FKBP-type peptidyl-prolyl cis-trans isomerase
MFSQQQTPEKEKAEKVVKREESPSKSTPAVGKQRKVAGGTVVEDLKLGHGPEVKPGKMVTLGLTYLTVGLLFSVKTTVTDGLSFQWKPVGF